MTDRIAGSSVGHTAELLRLAREMHLISVGLVCCAPALAQANSPPMPAHGFSRLPVRRPEQPIP
jgi:hypothetical protein